MKHYAGSVAFVLMLSLHLPANAVGDGDQLHLENRSEGPRNPEILKLTPHVPGAPANYSMNFMAGSWTGQIGSTTIEEIWTRCEGKDWIGIRKLTGEGKTTIYLFNFRGSGSYLISFMRKFGQDLDGVGDNNKIRITDLNIFEKNKAFFESGDEQFSYHLLESGSLKTLVNGQSVELNENRQKGGAF